MICHSMLCFAVALQSHRSLYLLVLQISVSVFEFNLCSVPLQTLKTLKRLSYITQDSTGYVRWSVISFVRSFYCFLFPLIYLFAFFVNPTWAVNIPV